MVDAEQYFLSFIVIIVSYSLFHRKINKYDEPFEIVLLNTGCEMKFSAIICKKFWQFQ